jgi:DNA-binding NtrC family response regulator
MTSGKVLLVDDEKEFTSILSQRLETRGLTVQSAANGKEALEKIQEESFDVIFLDLVMPEMNGLETLQQIKKDRPDMQVILLTGHADLKSGVDAIKMGAQDFLEKPADIQQLMEKIKEAHSQKAILIEQQAEEQIKTILGTKGW